MSVGTGGDDGIKIVCQNEGCGEENDYGMDYCNKCGNSMREDADEYYNVA